MDTENTENMSEEHHYQYIPFQYTVPCVFRKMIWTPACSVAASLLGGESLEGQLVNFRVPEIATLRTPVPSSQRRS